MPKLAGNFILIVVVALLGSCLKRPDKRAPRLEVKATNPPVLPVVSPCTEQELATGRNCEKEIEPTPQPPQTVNVTNRGDDEEETEEPEPVESDRLLATINVAANCHEDSRGCLYSKGDNSKYWLKCEIKGGGCGNGFLLEVKTEATKGLPQVKRGSVCRDGDKAVADLSDGNIALSCETDQDVLLHLRAKKNRTVCLE